MQIFVIICGVLWIFIGVVSVWKKTVWIHQGIMQRPVDAVPYCTFLGVVDIVMGCLFILNAVVAKSIYPFIPIIFLVFFCLTIFAECKYTTKDKISKGDV